MTKLLHEYQNGNCLAKLYSDGTREIEWADGEVKSPLVPFNMDVKITNYCDSTAGCMKHCHEKSNTRGQHSKLLEYSHIFDCLPRGVEIALGGGNTLSHPELIPFLKNIKEKRLVANLTVNQFHFKEDFYPLINQILDNDFCGGLGCSVTSSKLDNIKPVYDKGHLVFHLILGVHTLDHIYKIYEEFQNPRILLLGYKEFGNGISYYSKRKKEVDDGLYRWYTRIHEVLKFQNLVISFDNLALSQLNLKRFFHDDDWVTFYQGEDVGMESASMYIDLEKEEFSFSSRSPERFKIENKNVKEMFNYLKSWKN